MICWSWKQCSVSVSARRHVFFSTRNLSRNCRHDGLFGRHHIGSSSKGLAFVQPSTALSFFHSTSTATGSKNGKTTTTPTTTKTQLRATKSRKKKNKKQDASKEVFRADRVLSQRSDMTRSECFDLLKQKRIWQKRSDMTESLNDRLAESNDEEEWILVPGPSSKLSMTTPLWIDRTHEIPLPPPLVMAYHKPKWVLSVTSDPQMNRPGLDESIVPKGMHPVGRLDYDSSGLLLFSSSGALTQRLLHPKHAISKIYQVVVTNRVNEEDLQEKLSTGVKTGEGIHTADLLSVEHFDDDDVKPYLAAVQAKIPSHYNQTDLEVRGYLDIFQATALSNVTLRVQEGKYRMVRRIMANCGHPVVTLIRRQFGEICLDNLPEGKLRQITPEEEAWLESVLSGS